MDDDQVIFGAGDCWGVDANGNSVKFGLLQDIAPDFSFTVKELRGKTLFPSEVRRTEGKITLKAKTGKFNGALLNQLFFNGAITTGRERMVVGEAAMVPASAGPYTIVVANAANYLIDLGVWYADTGVKLDKVAAAAEVLGKYSVDVATGTYTFDATDAEADVLIDYTWTDATGNTIAVTNDIAGVTPEFVVYLRDSDDQGEFGIKLYACTSSKLSIATKLGDFAIPEFEFMALANSAGKVADIFTE